MLFRTPLQAVGFFGGMNRFLPPVSAPYGMPRKILIPVFAMPRTRPFVVSTSKNSGPFMRPSRVPGACARGCCAPTGIALAPAATTPARPALITSRRDCFDMRISFLALRRNEVFQLFRPIQHDHQRGGLPVVLAHGCLEN